MIFKEKFNVSHSSQLNKHDTINLLQNFKYLINKYIINLSNSIKACVSQSKLLLKKINAL